ncbi:unnamed protein product [Rotaria sp. Silwood2]|nr:unnamed protein product [Rotaria sp. Silwood2]
MFSLKNIARHLTELNLFRTLNSNENTLYNERLSTRLYLILLNIGIVTIFLYMVLAKQMIMFTINWPSIFDYEKLIIADSDSTIDCPCSYIAVEYRSFVTTEASFHQICSSDFVSELWIKQTYPTNLSYIYPMDIRRSLSAYAQLLRSFCLLSQVIVYDSMVKFGSSSLIAARLMSESSVHIQVNSSLELIQSTSSISSFLLPLLAIRRTTFGNQLVSGLGTNFYAESQYLGSGYQGVMIDNAYIDDNSTVQCFCRDWTSQCLLSAAIYEWEIPILHTNINYLTNFSYIIGTKVGCLPIESLLSSTLECYFNENCIRVLLKISNTSDLLFLPLNQTIQSRFNISSTIEILLNNLFIETWTTSINYTNFFNKCQPTHCTYMSITSKYSLFYIFNTMLGFIGGLIVGLRFLIPFIIQMIHSITRSFRYIQQLIEGNNNNQNNNNSMTNLTNQTRMRIHLRTYMTWIWTKIITLDLFEQAPHRNLIRNHVHLTTYIYVIFLSISLIILIIYNAIGKQTQTKTILNPNLKTFEQLEQIYGELLECPCSNIAIAHQYFIYFEKVYHPICTSELISPNFYEIFTRFSWISSSLELNSVSTWYFQLLNTFCSLSNSTVINAQRVFDATEWITTITPSRRIFNNRAHIIVNYYINHTRNQFINTLEILREISSTSQLMSVYQSSYKLTIINRLSLVRFDPTLFLGFANNKTTTCSCIYNSYCSTEAGQFQYNYPSIIPIGRLWTTPGINISCTPIDSLMQSTLECWYDENCIGKVKSYFVSDSNPITLNIRPLNLPINFQSNTTIQEIINNLMLDKWEASISYDNFFVKCAPILCTYTYADHNHVFYVISCVIALFGGLNMALYILTPFVVKTAVKIISIKQIQNRENVIFSIRHRFYVILNNIYQSFLRLNLFTHQSSDRSTIQYERTSTRLYLICLFTSTFALLIYICVSYETKTITIKSPLQSTYENLLINYPNTRIQCPCLRISIPYQTLITIKFDLHRICQSDFVSLSWLDLTFGDGNWSIYDQRDFRIRSFAYFKQLASLCTLVNHILINELNNFGQNEFISTQLISSKTFEAQLQTTLNDFRTSISTTFIRTLQLFRDTIQGNQIISIYTTNWIFTPGSSIWNRFNTKPLSHGFNCSCAISNECVESAAIYLSNSTRFNIPGLVLGCLPIESLLRSTLECFHNQTCVNTLITYLNNTSINKTIFNALDSTIYSGFFPNMTINELVNNLFVESESWKANISYTSFYSQCQPTFCTYTIIKRNSALFICTNILGLYGGLMKTFRHVIPAMMAIYIFILRKMCCIQNNSITPQIVVIDSTTSVEMK